MGKLKTIRSKKVADDDVDPGIREVLNEMRAALGAHGWKVHVERAGENLSFEFRNPLSPMATGMVFRSDLVPRELRRRLAEHLTEEPEFARTQAFDPPRRKRELLARLRYAATWYGWSDRVFQEVIETLLASRTLSEEEGTWLKAIGPTALAENVRSGLAKHRKAERRRAKSDRAQKLL